ncbi:MAG: sensor histidine kinase [Sphingomonas adhaesiva]|uniref:sensor histidine kinase n=1 Tax=Sphingomonas adhaesiva TaxID=28212 RepID=UPI002FFA499F
MREVLRALRTPSLGARLVLMLTAVGIAGALGATVLLASVLVPSFSVLERRSADVHVVRIEGALRAMTTEVQEMARDHADGVKGRSRAALVYAVPGRRAVGGYFMRRGAGVAAIGVAPDARGGTIVAVRPVTGAMLSRIEPSIAIDRTPVDATSVQPERHHLAVAMPLPGADGRGVASIRFMVPREVSTLGRRLLLLAIAGSVLLLLLVLTMLRRMIGEQVLTPLARLQLHMEGVRSSGVLNPFPNEARVDEIGALGRSFNAMLAQLRRLREQNAVQTFALGRSESAVAVMHNVRNALSPIGTMLSHAVVQPPFDVALVRRALDELAGPELEEDRRRRLIAFVMRALDAGTAAMAERVAQDAMARRALAHVLDIIGQQQATAHERPRLAACDLTLILTQQAAIAGHAGGAIAAFVLPDAPVMVRANAVLLSQVIGNLFANAAEAIAATGRTRGRVTVSVARGDDQVSLRIADDGEGFDPAEAALLFRRGFSTRAHKSGGLGLHWCANTLVAMDGTLRLESAGRGGGATATVTLLAATEAMAVAA